MENEKIELKFEHNNYENIKCYGCKKNIEKYLIIKTFYGNDVLYFCPECLSKIKDFIGNYLSTLETKDNKNKDYKLNVENEFKEYSKELVETIISWLEYKKRKFKRDYSERGLKSLFSQIKNQVNKTSESVVICKIENSIKNEWMGLTWDSNKFLEEDILKFFDRTWEDLVKINTMNKEEAKKYYLYLFRKISTIEVAKNYANRIYAYFKNYIENLKDEKYCLSFANFLRKNIAEYNG